MQIKLVGFNARYTHSCLALFYIRNELACNLPDAKVAILQLTINDSYHESLLTLSEGEPDYIFFSAAIWNSERVESLIRDLALCIPSTVCIVGGPQAHVVTTQLGEEKWTRVDGEIEGVGEQFYRDLNKGALQRVYPSSAGLTRRGSFTYPYIDKDFQEHLQNRHVYYESSRGCPFSCTYCHSAKDQRSFHKPLSLVKDELLHILSHRPSVVRFIDRTFNDKPKRALAIWEFLVQQQTETLFHFEIAPDRFDEEMYSFLDHVPLGRFQFEIGIQSTNLKTLRAIRRNIDPEETHVTVSRLVAINNIHLHVDLILGLPYETLVSFQNSFKRVFAMGAHYIQLGLLKILPDTPICQSADEYGYIHSLKPPYSVYANTWMDFESVSSLYWFCECVEKFYNNRYFVSFWSYFRRKQEDMYVLFKDLLEVCQEHDFFERAATQNLMCHMLLKIANLREDHDILLELLRYDWLRCGHRFLPEDLIAEETEQPLVVRRKLFKSLPEEIDGLYDRKTRSQFFKRGFFLRFSREVMEELGYGDEATGRYVRFSQQREKALYGLNRVDLV